MSVSVLSGAHAAAASSTASPHSVDGGGGSATSHQDYRASHNSPKPPNATKATQSLSSNAPKSPNHADSARQQMSSDVISNENIHDLVQSTSAQAVPGRRAGRRYY